MTDFLVIGDSLTGLFIVFARVGAAAMLLPAFGERFVPARVRLAGAFCLSIPLFWLGVVPEVSHADTRLIPVLLTEVTTGIILGVAARLLLIGLQAAGSIAAQATSLAQVFGGQAVEPLPAIGHLLTFGGLALIMATGYPVWLIGYLGEFYQIVPVGQLFSASILRDWGAGLVSSVFQLGFTLAAPFLIASVIYNLTIGFINKAMPQLMVAFVGAPFITFLSLAVLLLVAPTILTAWSEAVLQFLASPTRAGV